MAKFVAFSNYDGTDVVFTAEHFGGIYSTFYGLSAFGDQAEVLGIKAIRWPGGNRGESALDASDVDRDGDTLEYLYNIGQDGLLAISGKNLDAILNFARERDCDLSLFTPTLRYMDNLAAASADARYLITQLVERGAFTDGAVSKLTIEIGNESVGEGPAFLDGDTYASIANAQIIAITNTLIEYGIDPDAIILCVQVGATEAQNTQIINGLSCEALASIDGIVSHFLPHNIRSTTNVGDLATERGIETTFERFAYFGQPWEQAIKFARAVDGPIDLFLYASAWTVGNSDPIVDDTLGYQDYGARQARTVVDMISRMIYFGIDGASLWGVDGRPNPNFFSKLEDGQIQLSHGGEVFRLMAESLLGKHFMWSGLPAISSSEVGIQGDAWLYSFEDEHEIVLFLVADDIDHFEDVTIDLVGFSGSTLVDIVRVGTSYDTSPDTDTSRLSELPAVSHLGLYLDGTTLNYRLTQDYEVVRFTLEKAPTNTISVGSIVTTQCLGGTDLADQFIGSELLDVFSGGDGNDVLWGKGGNDRLFGGAGDDTLQGGSGSDRLDGGPGSDTVSYAGEDEVRVYLSTGIAYSGTDLDRITGIENIIGSGYSDYLSGDAADNKIFGGTGDDFLIGLDGDDVLIGGDGDDRLSLDFGDDLIDGGLGVDCLIFRDILDLIIDLAVDEPQATGLGLDTIRGIENVFGGGGDDYIAGDDQDNRLSGGAGNDRILGRTGNDTIIGGPGNDILSGGAGADQFVFAGHEGFDTITDFSIDKDLLVLPLGSIYQVHQSQGGSIITFDDTQILLEEVSAVSLSDFNVIFF